MESFAPYIRGSKAWHQIDNQVDLRAFVKGMHKDPKTSQ